MAKIPAKDIRNVCLLGHSAAGKTSIAEAMLYISKQTDRLGRVEDGNTVLDYDTESIKRGFSVSMSIRLPSGTKSAPYTRVRLS